MNNSSQNFESLSYHEPTTGASAFSPKEPITTKAALLHLGLFVLTFASVTYAGATWVGHTANTTSLWPLLQDGMVFAVLLLTFLGVHEFGHYFAAVYHNIRTTLPYFIPIPIFIGTMGAVIRIKEQVNNSTKLFDIGIAGPLAGFVVSLVVLLYGFATLPEADYIMNFAGHEAVKNYVAENGSYPQQPVSETGGNTQVIVLGNTLLYSLLASFFDNVPPMWEMYHYPFLFAGWLGLFFTALNLTPIGQLDGGHILYSLIGFRNHQFVARLFYMLLLIFGGVGLLLALSDLITFDTSFPILNSAVPWAIWGVILFAMLRKAFHGQMYWVRTAGLIILVANGLLMYYLADSAKPSGYTVWFVWGLFATFFVGVEHPPVRYEQKLDPVRTRLGWASMAIYVLCISPNPMYVLM